MLYLAYKEEIRVVISLEIQNICKTTNKIKKFVASHNNQQHITNDFLHQQHVKE